MSLHRPELDAPRNEELNNVWVVFEWSTACPVCLKYPRKKPHVHKNVSIPMAWLMSGGQWILSGFMRRRRRRKPQTMNRFFAKARRKLGVGKHVELKIVTLWEARVSMARDWQAFTYTPPEHRPTTRPTDPPEAAIALPTALAKRQRMRRYRAAPLTYSKRDTRYVVLGRRKWDREEGWLYLGPLGERRNNIKAKHEARVLHGAMYTELMTLHVSKISKRLRRQMARGRKVIPGATRLHWPEPLSSEDVLAEPMKNVSQRDAQIAIEEYTKKMHRTAKKPERKKEFFFAMAALMYLNRWVS